MLSFNILIHIIYVSLSIVRKRKWVRQRRRAVHLCFPSPTLYMKVMLSFVGSQ